MVNTVYKSFLAAKQKGEKKFALLIDPDKVNTNNIGQTLSLAKKANVDFIFLGGSLVVNNVMDDCIASIRVDIDIPIILFPGDITQVHPKADAILFLSLISGRNPELLIGKHVIAAPILKKAQLEVVSTGYMLIDGGKATTASYMSNSFPIPANKSEIAQCTALAGEYLGLKTIYMDAGSGAENPVSETMIKSVAQAISVPLIVGGGIRTPERAYQSAKAGADIIVVGNAIEKNPNLLIELAAAIHSTNHLVAK